MQLKAIDPRLLAINDRYVDGRNASDHPDLQPIQPQPYHVQSAILNQHEQDDTKAGTANQLLYGENLQFFPLANNSLHNNSLKWVQSEITGYVGYVDATSIQKGHRKASHFVAETSTLLFAEPNIKSPNPTILPMLSQIQVEQVQNRFSKTADGWIISKHLCPIETSSPQDLIAAVIELAHHFVGSPYLWGGNSIAGIDCSGLIHIIWRRYGVYIPRDSDQQQQIPDWYNVDQPIAGDLAFWPGHVGLMIDENHLLHANAHAMKTTIEPLKTVQNRMESVDLNTPPPLLRRYKNTTSG